MDCDRGRACPSISCRTVRRASSSETRRSVATRMTRSPVAASGASHGLSTTVKGRRNRLTAPRMRESSERGSASLLVRWGPRSSTNGSVSHPSSIPTASACFGDASIKYEVNGRQVASTLAPVLGNCTFSASTSFRKLPAKLKRHKKTETLKVIVRFRGNGYIGPSAAKTDTVTLG